MSFDVFFQGFVDGQAAPGGSSRMREVLLPFITKEEPEHGYCQVSCGDGTADLYLNEDGMMANHIEGQDPWDLLVYGASAAGWVILPMGCAVCLTDEKQRGHLPEGLDADVDLVLNGADLLRVIRSG